MAGLTEFVGELTRERWRAKEADSEFVIAEAVEVRPAKGRDTLSVSVAAESIVIIGNAPQGEFIPGLTYRFLGRWDEDRKDKYTGRVEKQFKFAQFVKAEPHSRYGLVSYIAKYAPGIGPVIAGRLFDAFGSDAVKVLREYPEKAVTVANFKGRTLLTLEKATEAADKLRSMGRMEDTKIELTGIFTGRGFPHTLVEQCIKVWGVLAPKRIARDPFSLLVRRLPGAGFARCDRLYNDLGLPPGRLKRQLICLWHAIRTDNNGNTWHPASHCKTALEQAVSGCKVNFVRAVKLGLRSRWLASHRDAAGILWLAEFSKAENEQIVAERLAMLLHEAEPLPVFQTEIEPATAERLATIEDHEQTEQNDLVDDHFRQLRKKIELGKSRGICQFCSRELTNPISRQMGYGEICAKNFGLPW